jgi:DNA-binding transcriptional LysR family regulator
MTDLNALVIFAKVVEAKSFSEAARRLRMPVSTVSRRVAELEDQLGVRLLDRSTRALRLNELGSEVLEHAQRSAEASEAVENIISNRQSNVTGTLRLSAPPNISETLLTPLVTAFQASYPNVRVQILIAERYVDHIADGVDIVFRLGARRSGPLRSAGVLAFGPENVLFVGDITGGAIHAFALRATDVTSQTDVELGNFHNFEGRDLVRSLDQKLAALFGTTYDQIVINDMVVHQPSQQIFYFG